MSHPGTMFHTHHITATFFTFLNSGLCPKVAVNCALLCCYVVSSSNFLLAFQDKLSVPCSEFFGFLNSENGNNSCPEKSVRNHHYSLHNNTRRTFSFLFIVIVITSCITHHVQNLRHMDFFIIGTCKSLCSTCGSCFHDKTRATGLTQMMLVLILSEQWLDYGSNDTESWFNSQHGQKTVLPYTVHNRPRDHPTSYSMGTEGIIPGLKDPECEADHRTPSSAEIQNGFSFHSALLS